MPSGNEELRRVLAQCTLEEKVESGEITLALRKICRYCDEKIGVNARKCPHCESILDPALLPKKGILDVTADFLGSIMSLVLWAVVIFIVGMIVMFVISR